MEGSGLMLDINKIRAEMATYLAENASHRHSLDSAVMHVVQIAYQQGMHDAQAGGLVQSTRNIDNDNQRSA